MESIYFGQSVNMKRSDGRDHPAVVSTINDACKLLTVECNSFFGEQDWHDYHDIAWVLANTPNTLCWSCQGAGGKGCTARGGCQSDHGGRWQQWWYTQQYVAATAITYFIF